MTLKEIKAVLIKLCGLTENDIVKFYELEYKISRLRIKNEDHPKLYEWENKLGQVCDKIINWGKELIAWNIKRNEEPNWDGSYKDSLALRMLSDNKDLYREIITKISNLQDKILICNKIIMWVHSGGSSKQYLYDDTGLRFDMFDDLSNGKYVPKWDRELAKIH